MKGKKGATLVLVVFMMIVLVTIGSFALLSANTNYKFSKEVLNWNKKYYQMEKESEQFIMDVDNILMDCKTKTLQQNGDDDSYYKSVSEELNNLKDKYPKMNINNEYIDTNINSLYDDKMFMFIKLKILPLAETSQDSRFVVEDRKEWQEYVEHESNIDFWNGEVFNE